MKTFGVLLKNELKLNIRNMNMVIFAILMPLVVLLILGIICGTKPLEGRAYTFIEQSIGALCAISICAGGLMGLPLVVSEYREKKILKRFKVTPVSPLMLLGVEFAIYVLYCLVSLITIITAAMLASLLYFPMLVFSGATLPFEVMPSIMQKIVSVFPLTQGISLMKATFLGLSTGKVLVPILIMLGVIIVTAGVAVKFFRWE